MNKQASMDVENNYIDQSMAPRKNRKNDRQAICLLYTASVVAASLSIAVASMQYTGEVDQQTATSEWGRPLFVSCLYGTSCLLLIVMAVYFELHRDETFEAVRRGTGTVPFSVKFSVKGGKVNLYLRLGLAMFGIMSIGHVVVKWAEAYTTSNSFKVHMKSILEMAFFALQTLFILRYHRLVILRYNAEIGAVLVHLLTTNLCIWADVSVGKIDKTLTYGKHYKSSSLHTHMTTTPVIISTTTTTTTTANISQQMAKTYYNQTNNLIDISFYLLPTVSEYCLLAAALLYEIVTRIGQPTFIELNTSNDNKHNKISKSVFRGWQNNCGSWFGIVTVLVIISLTIVTIASTNYDNLHENVWKSTIILIEEAVLCLFGILFVLLTFRQTRHLKFSVATRQSRVDEFLLYTAFFFGANYTISTIILAADFEATARINLTIGDIERNLLIGRCLVTSFELFQMILQTYFIQDSFYRCSDTIEQQISKPGRQYIVALLGINLALWIQQSFQLKNADILYLMQAHYSTYGWILFVVTMPISLFYRYHCTVCLSQCFNKLYEDETQRFEEMWRHHVDPLTDILVPTSDSLSNFEYQQNATPQIATTTTGTIGKPPQTDVHKRRMEAFSKTKPWRTFEIADNPVDDKNSDTKAECDFAFNCEHHPTHTIIANKFEVTNLESDKGRSSLEKNDSRVDTAEYEVDRFNIHSTITTAVQSTVNHLTNKNELSLVQSKPCLSPINHTSQKSKLFKSNTRKSSLKSSTAHRRLSLVIHRSKDLDIFDQDVINSNSVHSQQLTSETKTFERKPPLIRRRRTLKNLETAKYRVLAAELAHRMVIERTNEPSPTSDALSPNASKNRTRLNSFSRLADVNSTFNSAAITTITTAMQNFSQFEIVKAMNETAALTIAPVESKIAISIPMITVQNLSDDNCQPTSDNIYRPPSIGMRHGSAVQLTLDNAKDNKPLDFKRRSFREVSKWPAKLGFRKASSSRLKLGAQLDKPSEQTTTYHHDHDYQDSNKHLHHHRKSLKQPVDGDDADPLCLKVPDFCKK